MNGAGESESYIITGGAGFIGSHLVDKLMKMNSEVRVLDNLSSGRLKNLKNWINKKNFSFIKYDLLKNGTPCSLFQDCGMVFHLAANPEVKASAFSPKEHFIQNFSSTQNLLEGIRKCGNIESLVFTSSSTVYGEVSEIPTKESYGPLKPISVYGSSKLSSESLISAYAYTYGFKAVIYRLANVIGPRSTHGVIHDFILKLKKNPTELEILGDGTQKKSFIYIDDCINALVAGLDKANSNVEIFNIGSEDWISVKDISQVLFEEMQLLKVKTKYKEVAMGRGWKGDVKYMLLSIEKLKSKGWNPKLNSKQAVKTTIRNIINDSV